MANDEELEPCRANNPKLLEVSEQTKAVMMEALTSTLSNKHGERSRAEL